MLGQALRAINLKRVASVLFVGVAFLAVFFVAFSPSEVLANDVTDNLTCNLANMGDCAQVAATSVVNILVAFVAWLLYFAAMIFEATLNFSIHTNYNDLAAVKSGWILFRDLINILFIFILLYIAFGTVLKLEKANWKKQLASIIIAAILVNFSLFITRVAIDASNIVALGIHSQLTLCEDGGTNRCTGTRTGPNGVEETLTLSESISNSLGLPRTFDKTAFEMDASASNGLRNGLIRLGVISLVVWAFINVALLFITRTIVFVLLLVTSPIGVAGATLPMLQKPAEDWRKNLFNQSLVAPVFLLLMYIILKMASDLTTGGGAGSQAFSGGSLDHVEGELGVSFWLNFILLIAFIIAAVKITKDFSGKAGQMINSLASKAVGATVGLATGGAALAARGTIGMVAAGRASALAAQGRGNSMQARLMGGLSRSSFDFRTLPGAGSLIKSSKMNLGKASTGGYMKDVKDANKRSMEREQARAENAAFVTNRQARELKENVDTREREELVKRRDKEATDLQTINADELTLKAQQVTIDAEQQYLKDNSEKYEAESEMLREFNLRERRGESFTPEERVSRNEARNFVNDYQLRERRVSDMVANQNRDQRDLRDRRQDLEQRQNETQTRFADLDTRRNDPLARVNHIEQIKGAESKARVKEYAEQVVRTTEDMLPMRRALNKQRSNAALKIISDAARSKEQRALDDLQSVIADAQKNKNKNP